MKGEREQQLPERLFAARAGKTTLFKFRPYSTKTDRLRVREILVNYKIYFARPSQLNDPFDLSPRFEKVTRDQMIRAGQGYLDRKRASPQEREHTLEYLRACDMDDHLKEAEARARKRLEEGYSVFSLAGNRDHPMLWSHYAAGHTGLCIHFRADEGSLMGAALAVTYDRVRPTLPLDLSEVSDREVFTRLLLRKGQFWSYEDEYRWANYPATDWAGFPIKFEGQHATFSPNELSGITLGARFPAHNRKTIFRIAESHDPQLPVWQAVETATFEFEFERVMS